MQPTNSLPANYSPVGTLDLSSNKPALIWLNILGTVLFFLFGYLFLRAAFVLRPTDMGAAISVFSSNQLTLILAVLLLTAIMLTIHELIHGVFFWVFTKDRPHFGFKWFYAYAAAPDWYLPRNQHLVVGLAPLVLITLAGLALLAIVPATAIPAVLFFMTMNASGAVGDIVTVLWLLTQPPTVLVQDVGDSFTIYGTAQSPVLG
jgi:hypothetical protein